MRWWWYLRAWYGLWRWRWGWGWWSRQGWRRWRWRRLWWQGVGDHEEELHETVEHIWTSTFLTLWSYNCFNQLSQHPKDIFLPQKVKDKNAKKHLASRVCKGLARCEGRSACQFVYQEILASDTWSLAQLCFFSENIFNLWAETEKVSSMAICLPPLSHNLKHSHVKHFAPIHYVHHLAQSKSQVVHTCTSTFEQSHFWLLALNTRFLLCSHSFFLSFPGVNTLHV